MISFYHLNIQENSYKFPKFIENNINIIKIQNKFLWYPLEQIYAIGLTQSLIVHSFFA
jgi:hypothetical protein